MTPRIRLTFPWEFVDNYWRWVASDLVPPAGLKLRLLEAGREQEAASDDVWGLISALDREFVPSLSSRTDTTEHDLTKETIWGGPISFYDTVMKERIILATVDDKVVGIMTFIPHYEEEMLAKWSPSTYASTTGILPAYRRLGIAKALNDALETLPPDLASPWITRRTWSTNVANLTLLKSRNFEEVIRLKDHRGPGIDTIYLARRTYQDEAVGD